MKFPMVAAFAGLILTFRGRLISDLQEASAEVHDAAPFDDTAQELIYEIRKVGVQTHSIPLTRTETNPFADLRLLSSMVVLMRGVRPDVFLVCTIKPVTYGTIVAWIIEVERRFALITGLGYASGNTRNKIFCKTDLGTLCFYFEAVAQSVLSKSGRPTTVSGSWNPYGRVSFSSR